MAPGNNAEQEHGATPRTAYVSLIKEQVIKTVFFCTAASAIVIAVSRIPTPCIPGSALRFT
jgi:hypothetical protein